MQFRDQGVSSICRSYQIYHVEMNEDKVYNEEMMIQSSSIGISMHKHQMEFP